MYTIKKKKKIPAFLFRMPPFRIDLYQKLYFSHKKNFQTKKKIILLNQQINQIKCRANFLCSLNLRV